MQFSTGEYLRITLRRQTVGIRWWLAIHWGERKETHFSGIFRLFSVKVKGQSFTMRLHCKYKFIFQKKPSSVWPKLILHLKNSSSISIFISVYAIIQWTDAEEFSYIILVLRFHRCHADIQCTTAVRWWMLSAEADGPSEKGPFRQWQDRWRTQTETTANIQLMTCECALDPPVTWWCEIVIKMKPTICDAN